MSRPKKLLQRRIVHGALILESKDPYFTLQKDLAKAAIASCSDGQPADAGAIHAAALDCSVEARVFIVNDRGSNSLGDENSPNVVFLLFTPIGRNYGHYEPLCLTKPDGSKTYIFSKGDKTNITAAYSALTALRMANLVKRAHSHPNPTSSTDKTKTTVSDMKTAAAAHPTTGTAICRNFLRNKCKKGNTCKYKQVIPDEFVKLANRLDKANKKLPMGERITDPNQRLVQFLAQTANGDVRIRSDKSKEHKSAKQTKKSKKSKKLCNYAVAGKFCPHGDTCRFTHPSQSIAVATSGQKNKQRCNYAVTGLFCPHGDDCKFVHPKYVPFHPTGGATAFTGTTQPHGGHIQPHGGAMWNNGFGSTCGGPSYSAMHKYGGPMQPHGGMYAKWYTQPTGHGRAPHYAYPPQPSPMGAWAHGNPFSPLMGC